MPQAIKFGTDGWRGVIAEDFTFANVRACAQGVANYLKDTGKTERGLLIGFDTRFASEDFGAAVAEVLAANGIKAYLGAKAAPTPVVSFGILEKKASGGVIITASHNPAAWNGFKYKPEYGGSATPEITNALESRIHQVVESNNIQRMPLSEGLSRGIIEYYDPMPDYLARIGKLVDLERLRYAGLHVAVDSMHGAGMGYFAEILSGGSTKVFEINGNRNPSFPNMQRPEPITQNLIRLSATLKDSRAAVGLATDGDADRIGILDENGEFISQLQTFALLALYLLEVRGDRGALVKSITSTNMIWRLGELFKVPVFEMPVGFKYIGTKMMQENALIGGEESGGFGFRGHVPERDGILSGLYFLDMMVSTGKKPSQLVEYLYSKVGPHYYERVDLEFNPDERDPVVKRLQAARPAQIAGRKVAEINTMDGWRYNLGDGSWLQVRISGTEPVLRIYAESSSMDTVIQILDAGKELVGIK